MPTYEYECPAGHEFELLQKMSEKPRAKCPVCGRMASRKISGGAGLVFKGSGFYITDYGKDGKGPRKAEGAEKAEKAEKAERAEKAEGAGKAERAERAESAASGKPDKAESTPQAESKPDAAPAKLTKAHKKKATE